MADKIRLADRLSKINPSPTLAITAKAKKLKGEGKDVVSFAAGEPDFDTPEQVKKAACDAIAAGFTKYTPTTGTLELKKLICRKFLEDNGLSYEPAQVVVSCGAKHSIYNALSVLVNKGDEVIIPQPYWVSYPEMVNLCEGTPVFIRTGAENSFKVTASGLAAAVTPKTKVLILNSPSNPTGCVYGREELEAIAKICADKGIFVISDEIYEKIIFDGMKHVSIAGISPSIRELTVTVNGLSKSHSMTGWRIGYLAAPQKIADAVSNLQDHSTSNPASISQKAACAALEMPEAFSAQMCAEFEKRRAYITGRLDAMKKISYVKPQGAFYIFCGISKTGMRSMEFGQRMLDEQLVALIPGIAFGADEHVRISFATGMEQIKKGMDRLEQFLEKL
jgi:aspartate aminotransferase